MSTRFKNTLYTLGDYQHVDGHIRYMTNEDGTLFSGHYRTKIKPEATRCSPNSANKKLYGASECPEPPGGRCSLKLLCPEHGRKALFSGQQIFHMI